MPIAWISWVQEASAERIDLADVGAADVFVGGEAGGCISQQDPASLEDVAAVRHLERLRRILLYQQDGGALRVDAQDGLEDVVDQLRRQPHRRLIQQQDAWLRHQRTAHRQHLLLAAR